jgi:hypothetical protein
MPSLEELFEDPAGDTLSLDKDSLCDAMSTNLTEPLDQLSNLIDNQYKEASNFISDALDGYDFDSSDLKVDDCVSDINGMIDSLNEYSSFGLDSDAGSLGRCLGIDVGSIGLGLPDFSGIGMPSFTYSLGSMAAAALNGILGAGVMGILAAISGLKGLIDLTMLDDILAMINCFSECDGQASKAMNLGIEEKLNSIGLDISGDFDYSSLPISADSQNLLSQVSGATSSLDSVVKNMTGDLTKGITDYL